MNTQWYRMHDASPAGVFEIEPDEARHWNEQGFGIFATVNSFHGPRRKENLMRINAWAIDMDEGSKDEQGEKLVHSPVMPTCVVETKRGYQAYWYAQEGTSSDTWNAVVLERLVPYFGSDKNARDLCRILRVPGFWHLKDPANPFMVRIVWDNHVEYSEKQMQRFPWVPDKSALEHERREAQIRARDVARRQAIASGMTATESLWDAIWNLNCEDGLLRLSGHWSVSGEQYTFRSTARGNRNLFVNGKSSSCFIDENKRIGSLDGGGPTLVQWLRWFKHDWKTVIAVLKEIYPHLADVDNAAKRAS